MAAESSSGTPPGHLRRLLAVPALILLLATTAAAESYQTLDWTDLLPPEDLQALLSGPEIVHDTPEQPVSGPLSADRRLADQVRGAIEDANRSPFERALVSTNIRPEYHNKRVRIPGFIVPLEFSDDLVVSEFFLVPYYGACIHVPPPPPNQIIHVKAAKGVKLDALYTPFWVLGTLHNESVKNDMAHAAYSLSAKEIVLYEENFAE